MKFGLRFFCLPIHPMRIGNTMMNSMLFNVLLLLISCVSVVQFCTRAFASYARLTAAAALLTHVPAAAGLHGPARARRLGSGPLSRLK